MQNLTAHYNILFNARQIILQKEELMAQVYVDDFSEILSVYQDTIAKTAAGSKDLEAVTTRANAIISLKDQSHYLGDAYFLLGQANYLGSDYFNAVEFFDYVVRSFPENKELGRTALAWKARSLMKLNQVKQASAVLDTARQVFDAKKESAEDITGADLQFNIDQGNYEQAEKLAVQAVDLAKDKKQRIRWTFILAQLQEANKKPADAYKTYSRVVHSNASFELAFNATLNSLRIEEKQDGQPTDRITRLRTLLKDDKNIDFVDQIYFQIGETALASQKIDLAVTNYKLSVKNSTKNQKQKGLSYLRLADINFKYKTDYIQAKKYYDSTLLNLSPAYPVYQQILKKANNLQLLASRYQTIRQQDTLQALAKLNEADRTARINLLVDQQVLQQQAAPVTVNPTINSGNVINSSGRSSSSFYFYNPEAVNQGLVSFLQVWGKRRLEDNWRISTRTVATITSNPNAVNDPDAVQNVQTTQLATPGAGNYKQELVRSIPLTPAMLAQSNQIIFNAYADIAGFYKDILGDQKESINTYEYLLNRFPDNPNLPVIYYSLYRLYTDEHNEPQAEKYKNLLLKNYPQTQYARIILDPEYGKKMLSEDAQQNDFYNTVYDFYRKRQYDQVIAQTDSALKINSQNKLAPQLAYLKTVALGHQQKLEPFKQELEQIAAQYPDDRLITPLVKQHLLFIAANEAVISARPFALMDSDPNDIPFSQERFQQQQNVASNPAPVATPVQPAAPPVLSAPKNSLVIANTAPVGLNNKLNISLPKNTKKSTVKEASKIFTLADSTELYFVINVNGIYNLAPSRFGIGQFNRANYPDAPIKHQLKEIGQSNQLIYTGRFYSLGEVKEYAHKIVPLLPQIMKVPAEKYNFFIISRKNLDKLADSKLLDSYFEFYQANYL
ncbi:tetratricopeptide repeat protein [Mucilaginibacter sp. HMF7410]|uniref:Tetratricopeptide repeat protein n=2 Tax=Mucilaginibacter arboris TaxID=2682090 RepID=A0A7K1SSS6_9SPHI|nr:tetratricopeptide repeat protein [Mucilaginibacter arboris]